MAKGGRFGGLSYVQKVIRSKSADYQPGFTKRLLILILTEERNVFITQKLRSKTQITDVALKVEMELGWPRLPDA